MCIDVYDLPEVRRQQYLTGMGIGEYYKYTSDLAQAQRILQKKSKH